MQADTAKILTKARAPAAVALAAALLAAAYFSMTWRTGDEARYYVLSRALASGWGYVAAHDPFTRPETLTPPLYPLAGAAAMRISGTDLRALKILSAIFYVAAAPVLLVLLRRLNPRAELSNLGLTALGLFSVGLLTMSCWCMADTLFIFLSLLSLVFFYYLPERRGRLWLAFAAGVSCGLAYLARAAGLALIAGALTALLIHRRWKTSLVVALGFVAVALPWMIRSWVLTGSPEPYIAYLSQRTGGPGGMHYPVTRVLSDWARGFPSYLLEFLPRQMFSNLMDGRNLLALLHVGRLAAPLTVSVALLVLLGFCLRLPHFGVLEGFWILYWMMVCGLPIPARQTYYVFPMLPAAAYYLYTALTWIIRRIPRLRPPAAARLATGLALAAGTYALATAAAGGIVHLIKEAPRRNLAPWAPQRYQTYHSHYMDAWARYVEAAMWIGSNSCCDALITCRKPRHAFVFSGRKAWRYDIPGRVGCRTPWDAVRSMARRHDIFILEDPFARLAENVTYADNYRSAMLPLLEHLRGSAECIYTTAPPAALVWRIKKNPAGYRQSDAAVQTVSR